MIALALAAALSGDAVVGSWTLQRMEIVQSEDELKGKSWCANPRGLLIYAADGRMSASINCGTASEPAAVSGDPKDMVFYSGTYTVMPPDRVVHRVEYASAPSRVGQRLERVAKLEGDKLTLIGQGVKGLVRMVWVRSKKA